MVIKAQLVILVVQTIQQEVVQIIRIQDQPDSRTK
nr:MAG TPA: hypothetical protein [Bacteriophage sp.]